MTLVFKVKPVSIAKTSQKNNYSIIPVKRIQMGIKNLGNSKISCSCGK